METAKLFQNGNSQALRLPKKYRMPGTAVVIYRQGKRVILEPLPTSWENIFMALDEFPDDFMAEGRQQPAMQKRESF